MTTSLHGAQQTADGIHGTLALGPYANEAARVGASLAGTDVGKDALQSDTGAVWKLIAASPMRWQRTAGPMPVRDAAGTTYTTTINDADAIVRTTNASAVAVTIPPVSSVPYAVGDTIMFYQSGAGTLTLAPGAGVTLRRRGGSLVSNGQYSVLTASYLGSDTWAVTGDTV
jgi:hypothetical protein